MAFFQVRFIGYVLDFLTNYLHNQVFPKFFHRRVPVAILVNFTNNDCDNLSNPPNLTPVL